VLNVAVGIMLSFLAGMSVGIGHFRSGASNYKWIFDVLMGLASLVVSIPYTMRPKGKPRPRGIVEWLYECDKPLLMFDNSVQLSRANAVPASRNSVSGPRDLPGNPFTGTYFTRAI
jgi:hypothetical protein